MLKNQIVMTIETIPGYYIHVYADNNKMLTDGETVTKEIFAPINGDITMWFEIDEPIETL